MGEPQVLIVGAGPTRLALALWLARAGTPFRLIDRKAGPGEGSRAMAVQARTLEFYRQFGIADNVIAGGVHAGDRLPWVEGTDNYAPLTSLGWQLHVCGTAAAGLRAFAAGARLPLHEWAWTGAARRAGLARDALYLVRLDGHIGFARRVQDVERLRTYLGRFGIVGS